MTTEAQPAAAEQSKTVVLTSDNAAAFYAKKLDLAPVTIEGEAKVVTEEVKADAEQPELEKTEDAPKDGEKKEPSKLNKRFSELTTRAKTAEANAATERAAREAAEKRAADAEAKLNPPKAEVVAEDGKPDPTKYEDAFKYAEDLAQWTTDEALKTRDRDANERDAKAKHELVVKTWRERQDAHAKANPQYSEKIAAAEVQVSNEIRDAILESEVGPAILEHFADHPEDAERIGKLSVGGALREFGKLEARLEKKPEVKTEEVKKETKAAEISKAPAPITPINGGNGAAVEVPINGKGEFTGTPKQWRDLRRAGKIH